MLEDAQRNEIEELGEFGLIEHLTKNLQSQHKSTVYGVGDDAAVLGEGKTKTLVSTDVLMEGVHFDLSFHPLKHLGFKAVAVNVSDICAMNGIPKQILVSLAFSNRFSTQAIDELYDGIKIAAEQYGVDIVGGDMSSSRQGLMISITAIGEAKEDEICYRKGAKDKDLLCVSGDLGAAYLGLQLLEREKQVYLANPDMQPDLEGHDYVLQRQLKPEARLDIIKELQKAGIKPTSMIDVSDGLSSEILHLSKSGKIGFTIYETKLPIDPTAINLAEEFNMDPTTCALNGGEDYELLFTVKQEDFEKVSKIDAVTVIGYATEDVINKIITKNDNSFELKAQGWQHKD